MLVCLLLSLAAASPQVELVCDAPGCHEPLKLPHRANEAQRSPEGTFRYRVQLGASGGPTGVLLIGDMRPRVSQGGRPLLGTEGPRGSSEWNRPLLFIAERANPASLLIELEAPVGGHGGLRYLRVGPLDELQVHHARLRALLVTTAELATALALIFAALMVAVWLVTRSTSLYLVFAIAAALFALNNLNYHVFDPPLPYPAWDILVNAALDGFVVSLALFTRRMCKRPFGRVDKALIGYALLALLVPALAPAASRSAVHDALHLVSLTLGPASLALIVRWRAQLSRGSLWVLLLAGGVFFLVGVHDLLLLTGVSAGAGVPLIHLGALLLVVASFTALLSDLVRVLQLEKELNQTLEARVAHKSAELEAAQERLLSVAKEKTLSEERERLSRELHDGTAGQLVTVLAILETEPERDPTTLSRFVRHALDDLRMTIQSIDPTVESLAELLGTLRPFLEARVREAGGELRWSVELPDAPMASERLHGVQRILQEATTNALRHGKAREVELSARVVDGRVELLVHDDGPGFAPGASPGNGLRNMQARAARLGATLDFGTDPERGGARVRLTLEQRASS